MYKNMIGLEAEFLLRKDGELVFPADHGFEADDWPILAEIRGEPAGNPASAVANLLESLIRAQMRAEDLNLTIDLTGYATIEPSLYKEAMKRMGSKEFSQCKNIHGVDLSDYDDRVIEGGKITSVNISTGLHVHFSSGQTIEVPMTDQYEPLSLQLEPVGSVTLYRRVVGGGAGKKYNLSRITRPVVEHIVKGMDSLLPNYELPVFLKYRMPGFYELKEHGGFEYRSLPFTQVVLDDLASIVKFAFDTLSSIDL